MAMHTPVPISAEEIRFYREKGYLKPAFRMPETLLEHLRAGVDRICARTDAFPDLVQGQAGAGTYVSGIDHLLLKGERIFLDMLGSPLLRSVAEAICGTDVFPVQEFVVIKALGDPAAIHWHQDVVSQSPGTTCMIGLYLDAADAANGALRMVPGSQHLGTDICALKRLPSDSIAMQPGEILVHDLMVAHASGPLTSFPRRRVVYFEFMNRPQAQQDQVYSPAFIQARARLLPLAQEVFSAPPGAVPEPLMQEIRHLHQTQRAIKPANFCFEPD